MKSLSLRTLVLLMAVVVAPMLSRSTMASGLALPFGARSLTVAVSGVLLPGSPGTVEIKVTSAGGPVGGATVLFDARKVGAVARLKAKTHADGIVAFKNVTVQASGAASLKVTKRGYKTRKVKLTVPFDPGQPAFPIRAAFYYSWYPDAWQQSASRPSNFHPLLGYYSSTDPTILAKHIQEMQYGGISAGIATWWGPGTVTDAAVPALLKAAHGHAFHWALFYEPEAQGNPPAQHIAKDLQYIKTQYANDPSYLRINGHFVVFVNGTANDQCTMAERWQAGNTVGAFLVLKVFPQYTACDAQPQGWYQYAPVSSQDSQGTYSFTVSPGYWKVGQHPRLTRDLKRWALSVRQMRASGAAWQLVTTFNDWTEGTAVENASEWSSPSGYGWYLDVLHDNGNGIVPTPTPGGTGSGGGHRTPTPRGTPTPAPTPVPIVPHHGGDPVAVAAGDIACDPNSASFHALQGTADACHMAATANLIAQINPDVVMPLGDLQYEDGKYSKYMASYDPTWGRFKAITRPAMGNHDNVTGNPSDYFKYFGSVAGDYTQGWYSYDIGAWHVIVINSNCDYFGGCQAGSAEETWLRQDLATHHNLCTLAYWHHARWSSGMHGNNGFMSAIWDDMYSAGVDVVLNGHAHDYERLQPLDASGNPDPRRGIQEFIVGTGGDRHYNFKTVLPTSIVRNSDTFGVLELTLHPTGYDWQFVPEAGHTFTDSGSGACH